MFYYALEGTHILTTFISHTYKLLKKTSNVIFAHCWGFQHNSCMILVIPHRLKNVTSLSLSTRFKDTNLSILSTWIDVLLSFIPRNSILIYQFQRYKFVDTLHNVRLTFLSFIPRNSYEDTLDRTQCLIYKSEIKCT